MRIAAFLLFCCTVRGTLAQPGFNRNYCGFAPNDSIDITNDGIPDLVVLGARSGTDDEPSSSGTCRLYVMILPGTTLMHTRDAQGQYLVKSCLVGEIIPALDAWSQPVFQIPREPFIEGSIQVAFWGYGHQSALVAVTPELRARRYVFRTMMKGKLWHGWFGIAQPVRKEKLDIRVGALVPVDKAFDVR